MKAMRAILSTAAIVVVTFADVTATTIRWLMQNRAFYSTRSCPALLVGAVAIKAQLQHLWL